MGAKGSELKRVRQSNKSNSRNRSYKSAVKTAMKKVLSSSNKTKEIDIIVKEAISLIDKSANKKIIHKNKAARYKAKVMKER